MTVEFILVGGSFFLLVVYHIWFVIQTKVHPEKTSFGIVREAKLKWVRAIIEGDKDILAVQTMRNWVMASTFLASTSILINLGLLSVVFNPDTFKEISQLLNLTGSTSEALWMIKLFLMVITFFTAFFSFTLSIRHYNHASVMINMPKEAEIEKMVAGVAQIINSGARNYTIGMRCFYITIPLALWLFGPIWMSISTVILIGSLYVIDRSP